MPLEFDYHATPSADNKPNANNIAILRRMAKWSYLLEPEDGNFDHTGRLSPAEHQNIEKTLKEKLDKVGMELVCSVSNHYTSGYIAKSVLTNETRNNQGIVVVMTGSDGLAEFKNAPHKSIIEGLAQYTEKALHDFFRRVFDVVLPNNDRHMIPQFEEANAVIDWLGNFDALLVDATHDVPGHVHRGFQREVDNVWGDIIANVKNIVANNKQQGIDTKTWCTGHSKGAGETAIVAARLAAANYPVQGTAHFAHPPVGDETFSHFLTNNVKGVHTFLHPNDALSTFTIQPGSFFDKVGDALLKFVGYEEGGYHPIGSSFQLGEYNGEYTPHSLRAYRDSLAATLFSNKVTSGDITSDSEYEAPDSDAEGNTQPFYPDQSAVQAVQQQSLTK